jgi:hypothetical protein
VELYADRVSTTAGKPVQVMVSVYDPGTAQKPGPIAHAVAWTLYRVGWYGGSGARQILGGTVPSVSQQADCPMQAVTGLIRCTWTPTFSFTLPQDAISGTYLVKALRDDGWVSFTPLIVTDSRPADLLFQASVTTWQAYNDWGGESLYKDSSGALPPGQKFAVQVSFERPYAGQRGLSDAAHLQVPFARFMERNGYDVSYTTNLDVAKEGAAGLQSRGMFLSIGHDEYWAGEERAAADEALAAGVPMAFFGANPAYWKVRLEGALDPESAPLVTCYKNRPQDDPNGPGATGMFRSAAIGQPESELVGVMYDGYQLVLFPWVVADASSWLFAGTGVEDGDSFHGLIGNEFDRRFDGLEPAGVALHARSPVVDAPWSSGPGPSTGLTGSTDPSTPRGPTPPTTRAWSGSPPTSSTRRWGCRCRPAWTRGRRAGSRSGSGPSRARWRRWPPGWRCRWPWRCAPTETWWWARRPAMPTSTRAPEVTVRRRSSRSRPPARCGCWPGPPTASAAARASTIRAAWRWRATRSTWPTPSTT